VLTDTTTGTSGISHSETVYLWLFVSFKTTILCKLLSNWLQLQDLILNTTTWPYKNASISSPLNCDRTLILIQIVCASEISKLVFIATMQAQQTRNVTQAINYTQSLAAVQTLLRAGLGAIAYLRFVQLLIFWNKSSIKGYNRNLLPEDNFAPSILVFSHPVLSSHCHRSFHHNWQRDSVQQLSRAWELSRK